MTNHPAPRKRPARKKPPKRSAATPHDALTRAVLIKAATDATRAASRRAFDYMDSLLVAQDGWLVRIDREGHVLEKVKQLPTDSEISVDDLR